MLIRLQITNLRCSTTRNAKFNVLNSLIHAHINSLPINIDSSTNQDLLSKFNGEKLSRVATNAYYLLKLMVLDPQRGIIVLSVPT